MGYDANANPTVKDSQNNANLKTLDIDTTDSTLNKKKGGFTGYNFARTSAGFNTGNTGKT